MGSGSAAMMPGAGGCATPAGLRGRRDWMCVDVSVNSGFVLIWRGDNWRAVWTKGGADDEFRGCGQSGPLIGGG